MAAIETEPRAEGGLRYLRRGQGRPLVLLHGIGSDLEMWDPVIGLLAAERDVIALDMPGFGGSPPLAPGIAPDPAALAAGIAAFVSGIGWASAHVAGNSLGGWVALELAKAGFARSVTGLCPAGLWPAPLLAAEREAPSFQYRLARRFEPLLPRLVAGERGRRLVLSRMVARPDRVPSEDAAHMVSTYARSAAYRATNTAMRQAHFTGAESIDVPVTVAWGELDRVVRRQPVRVPDARIVELRGCGHIPTWDDPAQVARVVLDGSAG